MRKTYFLIFVCLSKCNKNCPAFKEITKIVFFVKRSVTFSGAYPLGSINFFSSDFSKSNIDFGGKKPPTKISYEKEGGEMKALFCQQFHFIIKVDN